jgi:stage II sporulation protein D
VPGGDDFVGWWSAGTNATVVAKDNKVCIGDKSYDALYFSSNGAWMQVAGDSATRKYRGWLYFIARAGKLTAINELPLETYLRGVVPCEMSPSWAPEALKAQAIAARTYTLTKIGAYQNEGFDVDDTTRCHTYKGFDAEDPRSDRAVQETASEIIVFNGKPIEALYATVSGGATASAWESFNGGGAPYLQSIQDVDKNGRPYAEGAKNFYWSFEVDAATLQAVFAKKLEGFGTLLDLRSMEKGPSGRTLTVSAVGSGGEVRVSGADLRRLLGPDKLRSTLFQMAKTDVGYRFDGKGWGHGVGMDQAGANGRAKAGQTCEQILKAYYTGVEIIRVPGSPVDLATRGSHVDRKTFRRG